LGPGIGNSVPGKPGENPMAVASLFINSMQKEERRALEPFIPFYTGML